MAIKVRSDLIKGIYIWGVDYPTYVEAVLRRRAARMGLEVDTAITDVGDAPALEARVVHGQLIVMCECGGAQFVWPEHPIFLCSDCWNKTMNGRFRRVIVPDDLAEIEVVLSRRLDMTNRNWLPTETLIDLKRENREHGLDDA
jgi:hypothetical protein